jgi:hypothetical protein
VKRHLRHLALNIEHLLKELSAATMKPCNFTLKSTNDQQCFVVKESGRVGESLELKAEILVGLLKNLVGSVSNRELGTKLGQGLFDYITLIDEGGTLGGDSLQIGTQSLAV